MTIRLPFTLTPLPGEPFGLWWHTYALRLNVTTRVLAHAVGISNDTPPGPEHSLLIAAAAGLDSAAIDAMFTTSRRCPPEHVLQVWAPQSSSRFCPDCLAQTPALRAEQALPITFYCLAHHRPSSDRAAGAQRILTALHQQMRDPAQTAAGREHAQDDLVDLTLVALHQANPSYGNGSRVVRPDPDAFIAAIDLTGEHAPADTSQRLGQLVTTRQRGALPRAVPSTWIAASPILAARIAHARDNQLTAVDRLRHATTLPHPHPRPRLRQDPAPERVSRLPDQLWPVWAIRLTDGQGLDGPVFRCAAIAGLLLPHSGLRFSQITALLPHLPHPALVSHQLRRLAETPGGTVALRILTELGLALDHHDVPIDYSRRRHLAATTDLIDAHTWKNRCRGTGFRAGSTHHRLNYARRYLYELITGGSLTAAPQPYRLPTGTPRAEHVEFCAALPADLVAALHRHAEQLLANAGIDDEPLAWHPPTDWVTVTTWPGTDPELTDPAPIHQALRARWTTNRHLHWAPTQQVADGLGISSNHLRQVLRQHPVPTPPYNLQRPGAIIAAASSDSGPGHRCEPHPDDPRRIFLLDPAWLRDQYLTWGRTLPHIAAEIGCRRSTLRQFAEDHRIPLRRGGSTQIPTTATVGHPAELPQPLRNTLRGQHSRTRLQRFLLITEYPSLNQLALATGLNPGTLTTQVQALERASGGALFHRRPRPQPFGPLTPLGEQLCQQARHYLNATPTA